MQFLHTLEYCLKRVFQLSLLTMGVLYFYKDTLPQPDFYDLSQLDAPVQVETDHQEFKTRVGNHEYLITPQYDYMLQGVVVSFHDADSFLDIWHHKRWQDYLNERDLCVIWGNNVASGVYQKIAFSNDSWTCWFSWQGDETGRLFQANAASNNHMLVDNPVILAALQASEPGDHVRFKGMLSAYANPANGFKRGTSTNRNDTGNGACETVYLTEFEIVKKANPSLRHLFFIAKVATILSLAGYLTLFLITPVRMK